MKTNAKKFMLLGVILAVLISSVVAFQVLLVANVAPGSSCSETDFWLPNLKGQFGFAGSMTGNFSIGNQTFSGTFYDTCLSNTTLVEMVCGGSINPAYSNLAAAIIADCVADGNATSQGMCVQNPWGGNCI